MDPASHFRGPSEATFSQLRASVHVARLLFLVVLVVRFLDSRATRCNAFHPMSGILFGCLASCTTAGCIPLPAASVTISLRLDGMQEVGIPRAIWQQPRFLTNACHPSRPLLSLLKYAKLAQSTKRVSVCVPLPLSVMSFRRPRNESVCLRFPGDIPLHLPFSHEVAAQVLHRAV